MLNTPHFLSIILLTIPYLTQGGTWTDEGKFDYALLGVGINSPSAAYAVALQNGVGSYILKTTDMGQTWTKLVEDDGLLDIGCASDSNETAVVISVFGKGTYTLDGGNTFKDSIGVIFGVQDIAKSRVSTAYGAPGGPGVSVSTDYGATWTHYKATGGNVTRYAALPTEKTWYLTAGEWLQPTTSTFPFQMYLRELTSRKTIYYEPEGKKLKYHTREPKRSVKGNTWLKNAATADNNPENFVDTGYTNDYPIWGAIWKTTDGGSTWSQSYNNGGSFYFNAIDCCDENVCYSVAEGDTESGSNNPGARIFGTIDGGNTWTQQYWNQDDAASLMAVHCINDNEAWAAGGIDSSQDYGGVFLHTLDAGKNWNVTSVDDAVLWMDISNDGKYGIATALTKSARGVVYSFQ